jgi:hypothetical protein
VANQLLTQGFSLGKNRVIIKALAKVIVESTMAKAIYFYDSPQG